MLQLFPAFMDDVDAATKIGNGHHRRVTKIAGVEREFETRVVDHVPAEWIAWKSVEGLQHDGKVRFDRVDAERTAITRLPRPAWTAAPGT